MAIVWTRDPAVIEIVKYFNEPSRKGKWDKISDKEYKNIILRELDRCRQDFSYASRNYFWIVSKKGEDIPFRLWESQELILEKWYWLREKYPDKAQKIMILKARQLGCSTVIEGLIAWATMFFSNRNALVVSHNDAHAAYLYKIVLDILDKLPWWLRPMVASRKQEQGLLLANPNLDERDENPGNMSLISVQSASQISGVGQGMKLNAVHASEYADWSWDKFREIIDGDMSHAIADNINSFAFLESTGKGAGSPSEEMWVAQNELIEMGEGAEWTPVFIPWFFEKTRVMAPEQGWVIQQPESDMRKKVASDWVMCDNLECGQYFESQFRHISRINVICPECQKGTLLQVILSDPQLRFMQNRRANAEHKGPDSVKRLKEELACVIGRSRVSTDKGIIPIARAEKTAWAETGLVSHWYSHGNRDVVCVKTKCGRELVCTPEHRLYGTSGEEIEARALQHGQQIQLSPPRFARDQFVAKWEISPGCEMCLPITREWGRFLGYWAGDGCWRYSGVQIACDAKDQDVVEDVAYLLRSLMDIEPRITKRGGMVTVDSSDKRWFQILKGLGVLVKWADNKSGWKRLVCVPECIWSSPREVVKEFLSGVFECDGHAYKDSPRTSLFAKNRQFLSDIQLLLLGFEINSTVHSANHVNGEGRLYTGNNLSLRASASNDFHGRINFISSRKKSGMQRPPRVIKPGDGLVDFIESVVPYGVHPVYDLTIKDVHKFGANGILGHNTTAEEAFQLTGIQVFPPSCQEYVNMCVDRNPLYWGNIDRFSKIHYVKNPTVPDGAPLDYENPCGVEGCRVDHRWDPEKPLQIWEVVDPNALYCIGADVAEGLSGKADFSVAFVNKYYENGRGPDEQVAMWRSNTVDPIEFAGVLNALGRYYNTALISVEVNKYDACDMALRMHHMYPNPFIWKHYDSKNPISQKLGWFTNQRTKSMLWQTAVRALKARAWMVRSDIFANEMKRFQKDDYDSISASAERNFHDDVIIAGMISLFCAHDLDYGEELDHIPIKGPSALAQFGDFTNTCKQCKKSWNTAESPSRKCPNCRSMLLSSYRNTSVGPKTSFDISEMAKSREELEADGVEFHKTEFDPPDDSFATY